MHTCRKYFVDLAVTMLKAAALGFERFEFRNAEATKAWCASGSEAVFLESMVEEKRHVVPANERTIDPHEIDIHDVVHEFKELDLCPRGLRDELAHSV